MSHTMTSYPSVNQCGEIQAPMYRVMTKGRQWLWVQPRLYLQYHQWSRKAESINVTHYVVTYQDYGCLYLTILLDYTRLSIR